VQILVLANPLVYISEAMRTALTPTLPHMTPAITLPVLAATTLLLGYAATRSFTRRVFA